MSKFQPDGWHTVTPRILVRDPENLVMFIKQVFYGRGEFRPGLRRTGQHTSDEDLHQIKRTLQRRS